MKDLEGRLAEVRQEYIRRMVSGDGALLRKVEEYMVERSGKMLRPRLTLLSAATLGEEAFLSRRTLLLATAVEMIHNISLIHDDVIDGDDFRRGRPSVNGRWGNRVAILVGDYHFATLLNLLNEIDDPSVSRMIGNTVRSMVEAELLQQELPVVGSQQSTYQRIVDGKTASLFATACAIGNPECYDFGLCYGRLFQCYDDIADGESTAETEALIATELPRWKALANRWPDIVVQLPPFDCNKTAQAST